MKHPDSPYIGRFARAPSLGTPLEGELGAAGFFVISDQAATDLEIARRQRLDPQLRSEVVQREVLHIRLVDLQHELMTQWRLPSLLVHITDHGADHEGSQVRNVLLAIQVARHSANGWDNPAIPDDLREIAALLQLGVEPTLRMLRDIDQPND